MNTRNPKLHLVLSVAMVVCGCVLLLVTALARAAVGMADYAVGAGLLVVGLWNLRACLQSRGCPGEEAGGETGDTG